MTGEHMELSAESDRAVRIGISIVMEHMQKHGGASIQRPVELAAAIGKAIHKTLQYESAYWIDQTFEDAP